MKWPKKEMSVAGRELVRPVFVVSTGRAGSMMIARTLGCHPLLLALHEPKPHLSPEAYARWAGTHSEAILRKKVADKRDDLISQTMHNGLSYIESSHYTSHLIPILRERYDARFVHLFRDGRSFVRSGMKRSWWYSSAKQPPVTHMRKFVRRVIRRRWLVNIGDHWEDHRLSPPKRLLGRQIQIAWLWAEINRVIIEDLKIIPKEDKISIRLEDFDERNLKKLINFVGVEAKGVNLEKMINVVSGRPNNSGESYFIPHQWSPEVENAFQEIAGPVMNILGYK